jgi:hypothetical protein
VNGGAWRCSDDFAHIAKESLAASLKLSVDHMAQISGCGWFALRSMAKLDRTLCERSLLPVTDRVHTFLLEDHWTVHALQPYNRDFMPVAEVTVQADSECSTDARNLACRPLRSRTGFVPPIHAGERIPMRSARAWGHIRLTR